MHAGAFVILYVEDNDLIRESFAEVLTLVSRCPAYVWGRDALGCGDMWNSNSLVAWLLTRTLPDVAATLSPPTHGRAPGWASGVELARRQRRAPSGSGGGLSRGRQESADRPRAGRLPAQSELLVGVGQVPLDGAHAQVSARRGSAAGPGSPSRTAGG